MEEVPEEKKLRLLRLYTDPKEANPDVIDSLFNKSLDQANILSENKPNFKHNQVDSPPFQPRTNYVPAEVDWVDFKLIKDKLSISNSQKSSNDINIAAAFTSTGLALSSTANLIVSLYTNNGENEQISNQWLIHLIILVMSTIVAILFFKILHSTKQQYEKWDNEIEEILKNKEPIK